MRIASIARRSERFAAGASRTRIAASVTMTWPGAARRLAITFFASYSRSWCASFHAAYSVEHQLVAQRVPGGERPRGAGTFVHRQTVQRPPVVAVRRHGEVEPRGQPRFRRELAIRMQVRV